MGQLRIIEKIVLGENIPGEIVTKFEKNMLVYSNVYGQYAWMRVYITQDEFWHEEDILAVTFIKECPYGMYETEAEIFYKNLPLGEELVAGFINQDGSIGRSNGNFPVWGQGQRVRAWIFVKEGGNND